MNDDLIEQWEEIEEQHTEDIFDFAYKENFEKFSLWFEQQKTDPDACDISGYSLLHITSLRGNVQMSEFLLAKGTNVNICDRANHTPLHFASFEGNVDCVKLLLKYGAEVDSVNHDLMIVIDQQIPVYIVGGRTPLHYAAEQGHLGCVRLLIDSGADPRKKDLDGYTPFHLASLSKRDDVAMLLNPFPGSIPISISPEEFTWLSIIDYRKRSLRAANHHKETLNGDCCLPCKYLLQQSKQNEKPE
mmetsp:Transcript_19760/g.27574  ORF Transcript_19760/g.27574 Transcript_19760/m.27574 type:complete len:245 (+) Transcript_19760:78-812(+)